MKTLYFDCGMGAAGDMLTAALLELIPDQEEFITQLNALGIPGVVVSSEKMSKCGIGGTHITVKVHGEEEDEDMHEHTNHTHPYDCHEHDNASYQILCEHSHVPHEKLHGHEHVSHEESHGHEHVSHEESHGHEHVSHEESHGHEHVSHEESHGHEHVSHEESYGHEHVSHEESHGHEHVSHEEFRGHEHFHEAHVDKTAASCHEPRHHHDHAHDTAHTHHHSGMHEITHIVHDLPVSGKVKEDILAVYGLIAEAESHAHGVPVTEIHFHEVGTMDAVADVTAVCLLMEKIAPDQVLASPIHVGSGQVKCAHGILPVPAPATAYILRDVPIYGGEIRGELCTPTGAALLKHFVTRFGAMPVMRTNAVGYGMGRKDFPAANCVRAMLGETADTGDTITELNCNVDDMTGEAIGFAMDALFTAGALEVYTVPIGMKKSRPGTLLCVMCRENDKEEMVRLIFKYTTTIGIRENIYKRYTLERSVETVQTRYGDIRKKISTGYGVTREKYEYEDLARAARENGISVSRVMQEI